MKKLIATVNFLIILSIIALLFLGYYEIQKYNLNIKTQTNSLIAQGKLTLKALEGAPKYFGSIKSISVIQLAEELSKNENINGILIFTEEESIYKTKSIQNKTINLEPKEGIYETKEEIFLTKILNPEDALDPNIKTKLSTNFFPLYYATVILSKSNLNSFINSSQKDIYIIFVSIIFVIILLIILKFMIKRYETLSMELVKAKQIEEIANLANILAHEIKNPLSSIKGFSNYIYNKLDNEELMDYMDKLLDEIDRLKQIVDDFNAFGKQFQLEKSEFYIKTIIDRAIVLLKHDADRKNLRFTIVGEDFNIVADENKILQVFINLIVNAINASIENSDITIELSNKKVKIANQHNNKNIDIEKLFTPFYTTNTKGSGLGLAICKKIMSAHNFDIYVEKVNPFVIVLDFN